MLGSSGPALLLLICVMKAEGPSQFKSDNSALKKKIPHTFKSRSVKPPSYLNGKNLVRPSMTVVLLASVPYLECPSLGTQSNPTVQKMFFLKVCKVSAKTSLHKLHFFMLLT